MNGYPDFTNNQQLHQQQPQLTPTNFVPTLPRSSSSSSSIPQYNPAPNNNGHATGTVPYTYLQSHLGASSYRGYLHDIKPTLGHLTGDFSSTPGSDAPPTVTIPVIAGIGKKKASSSKRISHIHGLDGSKLTGEPRKKRSKSHMVCEGGRPCERCIKREIPHLCRDFTPPPHHPHAHSHSHSSQHSEQVKTESPVLLDQSESSLPLSRTQSQTQTPSISVPGLSQQQQQQSLAQSQQPQQSSQQQTQNLFSDPNFPPTWPLLPDTTGQLSFSNSAPAPNLASGSLPGSGQTQSSLPTADQNSALGGTGNMGAPPWGTNDDGELAALNKFMKDLGVPALPGDFFSFMNQMDGSDSNHLSVPISDDISSLASSAQATPNFLSGASQSNSFINSSGFPFPTSNLKGKNKPMSRVDKFMMAAADQPNGTRASRLAQVIKAKYDAGLLKPYDYVKGYERMNKWMESGRAAPRQESRSNSEAPDSPASRPLGRNGRTSIGSFTPVQTLGKSISPESRRRILAALAGFRPKFRQIAQTLTNVDLVFVEEAMERWMLEYDRAFASIHTPSCIWRRTGEIQKANQDFSNLTGIPASMFRDGQLCVYELMDEESAVRYWEGYAKIAFDATQRSMYIHCTLHIPNSLARHRPRYLSAAPSSHVAKSAYPAPPATPDLTLPQSIYNEAGSDLGVNEEYREVKCCFSVTIRRDAWGVPVAIMGQWIPI